MSDTEQQHSADNEITKRATTNKRTLYLMLLIGAAPIALAYFSFFTGIGVPDGTVSHGEIINPALNINVMFENENQDFYADLMKKKRWHVFIPMTDTCDNACQQILYTTRQVHVRLGEKSPRVERILVHLGRSPIDERMQSLQAEHPLLRGIAIQKSAWLDFIRQGVAEADPEAKPYYVLVDQEGFAMMRYSADTEGGDLLKDLKRALKHSIDYQ